MLAIFPTFRHHYLVRVELIHKVNLDWGERRVNHILLSCRRTALVVLLMSGGLLFGDRILLTAKGAAFSRSLFCASGQNRRPHIIPILSEDQAIFTCFKHSF